MYTSEVKLQTRLRSVQVVLAAWLTAEKTTE
jgi:hypothetical protein